MAAPGVVFTKDWVVDFVLDVAGYTTDKELVSGCIIEPSCGDGAFLRGITSRLCESASRRDCVSADALKGCVKAYDLDSASVERSRNLVSSVLVEWTARASKSRSAM